MVMAIMRVLVKLLLSNLNLAEVRGGDQVVVKENDETKNPIYLVVVLQLLLSEQEHVQEQ